MIIRVDILILIILFMHPSTYAGRTLTNQDLKKDERAGDEKSTGPPRTFRTEEPSLSEKLDKITEEYDQDHWCRMGNLYRGRVDDARKEYKEADEKLRSYSMMVRESFSYRMAESDLKYAKERLEEAERELREFEDRAYRQDIPASWYRCQYE